MTRPLTLEIEDLRTERTRKRLSLGRVSVLSGVGYHDVSRILNGWLCHPRKIALIRRAITKAPNPPTKR